MSIIEGTKSKAVESVGAPTNGVSQNQGILGVGVTTGTFVLSFQGFRTVPIAFNAIAATVQLALEALPSIGTGNIAVAGGPLPGTTTTAFQGSLAKKALPSYVLDRNDTDGTISLPIGQPGVDAFQRESGPGARVIDVTNGVLYINAGSAFEPAWTVTGTQT